MPIQELARVIDNREVAREHFKLVFSSQYISSHALPGQFVQIKCSETFDPLLRRPLGIHRVNKEESIVEVLFRVVGKGTKYLSTRQIGSTIEVFGPLGKGFEIDKSKQVAIFVAGGAGAAPLLYAADEAKKTIKAVYAVIGANTRDTVLCEGDFKALGVETIVTTDDGSSGKKGLASDILLELLASKVLAPNSIIYSCGPGAMQKAVSEIAKQYKVPCQLSLEEWMACGIGACKGCAVKTKSGYKMVCKDGPVFNHEEIIWK